MNTKYLVLTVLFCAAVPVFSYAKDECRLVEYPDHYEAVCIGDAQYVPVPQEIVGSKPVTVVVVNGERRPPPAIMEEAADARKKLILELRQKDVK